MNLKAIKKFEKHIDTYFEQTCETVLHPVSEQMPHIDVLLYKPTEKYPFWKLVTMGASDYTMPKVTSSLPNRNEYMMFLDKNIDVSKKSEDFGWYYSRLLNTALYPIYSGEFVTYGHTVEFSECEEEMNGSMLLFPEIIEDSRILRCKLGLFKECACLQVMPVTQNEMTLKMQIGAEQFSYHFYPEDGNEPKKYLAEKNRT